MYWTANVAKRAGRYLAVLTFGGAMIAGTVLSGAGYTETAAGMDTSGSVPSCEGVDVSPKNGCTPERRAGLAQRLSSSKTATIHLPTDERTGLGSDAATLDLDRDWAELISAMRELVSSGPGGMGFTASDGGPAYSGLTSRDE